MVGRVMNFITQVTCINMQFFVEFQVSRCYRVTRGGGAYKLHPQNINFWKMFNQKINSIICWIICGSMHSRIIYYELSCKNMNLAKNSPYAKMRENLRKFAKIKWAPVRSLLHVGYSNCTKMCTVTCFIGILMDFLYFHCEKNDRDFKFDNFFGGKKNFLGQKFFLEYIPHYNWMFSIKLNFWNCNLHIFGILRVLGLSGGPGWSKVIFFHFFFMKLFFTPILWISTL